MRRKQGNESYLASSKCYIVMQTLLESDIYLQSNIQFISAENNINKTKEFELFLCQYLRNNICNLQLISLDHVTNALLSFGYNLYIILTGIELWYKKIMHELEKLSAIFSWIIRNKTVNIIIIIYIRLFIR